MGSLAVPLLLAGGSAVASGINTRRTERRQDRAMADAIRNQGRQQQKADARVNAELDRMAASNPAADRRNALAEYVAQVAANRAQMNALGAQGGRVSDAYADAAANAALGVADTTQQRAGLMATQDAAARMREREERDRVRLGGDIGLIRRAAQGQGALDDMRIRSIRRNPWLDAAAQVLGGMAASGVGARAPAEPSVSFAQAAGWGHPQAPAALPNFAPHMRFGGSQRRPGP